MRPRRPARPDIEVARGERMLAWCESVDDVVLAGTRAAFYLGTTPVTRIAWEQIESADWDNDTNVLRVVLVGSWGSQRPTYSFGLTEPARLLELVRERVTASVVLQRHVPLEGRRGVRVIGRKPPQGAGEIEWFFDYDQGVDPEDPVVREASATALAEARADVGES